ncbi:hypothetical protein GCM10010919_21160 [Alishewanella longhuensis]|uniref:Flagellar hook-length control protein-like C-terminal domain-containing protein n=1 Tax=Alishewanella longhuensis TaxID=1091037 RepID=A0ABQ3L335_9ALTE|nr:flagellar hook-length control protein FliK [Alishewanella longhuensis]GHG70469.1 hypothetical protein GCM10010919_21160 [Alishewanella longhuensis]
MQPLQPGSLPTLNQLVANSPGALQPLLANTPYNARLVAQAADSAILFLQQPQGMQQVKLQAPAALPTNMPLQLSFSAAPNNAVNVKVMQWQGQPQAIALSQAQAQWLTNPTHLQQLAKHFAQGEMIRHLAGETFNLKIPTSYAQLHILSVAQQAGGQVSSFATLITQFSQSDILQKLSPALQQLLLQPQQQVALQQQLLSNTPILQLGDTTFVLNSTQRSVLQTLLTPLIQHLAHTQLPQASAVLLVQPLKALPDVQLTPDMLATKLTLLGPEAKNIEGKHQEAKSTDTKITLQPNIAVTRELTEKSAQPASSKTVSVFSLLKGAITSLKEDAMKAVNLEKMLNIHSPTTDPAAVKLQPSILYFAKLQQLSQQQSQLIVQTAQGPLKLALNSPAALQSIPLDIPLQMRFSMPQPGMVELEIKILTALPQTVALTKAQAELLQDPKQLALLQQRLQRGESVTQLANEPLKIPLSEVKALHLNLVAPTENIGRTTVKNNDWQLSIQPVASEQKLRLPSSDFLKPLPLSNMLADSKTSSAHQLAPSTSAWRQLLPLLEISPATLRNMPEMPQAVQQLLLLVRQAQPDNAKILSVPQVQEQLQAALQFQPLQAQPNLGTAAGTLAVAIQLLLGHLLRQPLHAGKETTAQRLAQNIAQLDQQQSSQLLRALGSHSSALQLAQLQNADTASIGQQWLIPLALQQQQESRLSQILIEQREAENKEKAEQQKYWQLTMKFDLGRYGQLMAVAKLNNSDVQLQFYTDEPLALRQAEKFLPLLTERCTAQGLNVSTAQCQLGKIPDTLGNRRTSLISTKA